MATIRLGWLVITEGGKVIAYVGTAPWLNAVTPSPTATTLTIYVDGDQFGQCGLPYERIGVHQDAHSVQVLAVGYADPLPPGVACAGHRSACCRPRHCWRRRRSARPA